jgi:hypothetical protein
MKLTVLFFWFSSLAMASGSLFEFKDAEGFEKCLSIQSMMEKTNTANGFEKRSLEPWEIQERCAKAAADRVAQDANKKSRLEYLRLSKARAVPETALFVVDALATADPAFCNEMAAYEILTELLSQPDSTTPSYRKRMERTRKTVNRCLKDKQFRSDFLEEKDSPASKYLQANACQILKDAKMVNQCSGPKQ